MSEYIINDLEAPRFAVNRKAMVDPDVFARERERIFDRCWLYVGHESELAKPNDFVTRSVGGRPVLFARDAKNDIRVWINSCPHRGAMLCREPRGNARFLTCFYHGWSFSTGGGLVSVPDDEGYGPDFERPNLVTPPRVESYRGFVFLSFDPDIVDLPTYLGDAAEYIDLVADQSEVGMRVLEGTHEYSAKVNWKLLVENSYDGYHLMSTHQRYLQMVAAARGGIDRSTIGNNVAVDLGNGHAVMAGRPIVGGLFGRPLSEAGEAERAARFERFRQTYGDAWVDRMSGTRNLVIFPNLCIIDLVMGVAIRKIDPIAPDYLHVSAWHLVPPEEGEELHRQRLDNFLTFWGPGGLATPDDVEALESCQRSYAAVKELPWSDISRGMKRPLPHSSDELQMRLWWRRWNELMTGEKLPAEEHDPLPAEFTARRRPEPAAAG
ncbi:p-cumate dioxygenase [Streptomyces sp. MMG1533]|uniref:aromatic ring-hydroxylating oxygenase subunit alpha n=1 Tax=Streptomyces sp. MMG1533 TaxID=1415546 RepID=UPI0006AF469F|nr:aromatic ring-hydroxylating dioxygenase subunit alpha [Streptomyces sp. MMG1533]KOU59803.1 p-cumate dioxygenase [Streptomyces sp. MMG1533]